MAREDKAVITRKGINYYRTWEFAAAVRDQLVGEYPEVRIVAYQLGYAVQLQLSGAYVGPVVPMEAV